MMRSLYSGVAGLRTHQTKMDVIGNNIANVNTTSYKSQSIVFSDLMYQTTQTASGATQTKGGVNARQIGLGVRSGAINTAITAQGASQTTNNPFDIMITGESFFVVNNGDKNLYTRDGSFYIDGAGNLAMQSNGYLVQGWASTEDPKTGEISINRNGGLSSLQIMSAANNTYSPASTTSSLFSGNIDDRDSNVVSDNGKTVTLEIYDNKGYLYTAKFTLKDTGEDHKFALTLTDIINSDGKSINKVLDDGTMVLDHVTFGEVKTQDPKECDDTFEVAIDATTGSASINLLAGAKAYESVPLSGTLSDLMESSKSSYAGVLKTAYGISDGDVDAAEFDKTADYEIDPVTGQLTINYTATDYQGSRNSSYNYTTSVNSNYYIDDTTGKGYKVPGILTNQTFAKLTTYEKETFGNVFGATIDENHTYSFNGTNLVTKKISTLPEKENATSINVATLKGYALDFGDDFNTFLNNYADTDNLYYTFNGETVNIYEESATTSYKEETTFAALPTVKQSDSSTYTYTESTSYQAISDLSSILEADDLNNLGDLSGYEYFKITQESGTFGIIFYTTVQNVQPSSISAFSGTTKQETFNANLDKTDMQELTTAFTNAQSGFDYVLKNEAVVSDYSENMLKDVFGMTDAQISEYANDNVSFNSNGSVITVSRKESAFKDTDLSKVSANYDSTTNTIYYTTTAKQTKTVITREKREGNISDLLTTAAGNLKGVLNDVYGISDAQARAYGLDGTYKIDDNGDIILSTGKHSINLDFDPATGGLISANDVGSGFVDMLFDQSVESLEAFGHQSGPNDTSGKTAGSLNIDFSTVSNYNTNGSSTIKAVKGDSKSLNTGRAVGEMNGVSISNDGQIYATYSNGQTKLLGQIASAEFANASGLSKEGDNLYNATLNSGEATIQDITTDGGYMSTGVLEMSNVDLSREFTEMITTQRGFQANSRIITVSDTLLEELANLKR